MRTAVFVVGGLALGAFLAIVIQVADVRPTMIAWPAGYVRSFVTYAFTRTAEAKDDSDIGRLRQALPKDVRFYVLNEPDAINSPTRAGLPWFFDYADRTDASSNDALKGGESFSSLYAALVGELAERFPGDRRPSYVARAWLRLSRSQTLNQNDPDIGFVRTVQAFMLDTATGLSVNLNQGGFTEQRNAEWSSGGLGITIRAKRGTSQVLWSDGNDAVIVSTAKSRLNCFRVILGDWYDAAFLEIAFRSGPEDIVSKYRKAPNDLTRVPYCLALVSPGPIEIQAPFGFVGTAKPSFIQAGDVLPGEMRYIIDQRTVRQSGGAWAALARGTPALIAVAYQPVAK